MFSELVLTPPLATTRVGSSHAETRPGAYGEAEFIFSSIKVITITGLLILGLVLDLGGGPNHDRIGFRYWKNPGPFVQFDGIGGAKGRFLSWSAVMSQAAFSFIGTEVVAVSIERSRVQCPFSDHDPHRSPEPR